MTEIKGKGVPTNKTKGAIGCIYTDENTGASYKCTGAYGINGVESYEWKRISESNDEKIPVGENEENKVETVESVEQSFEQFMNPPVETEESVEAVEEKPVEETRERVPQNNGGKHKYGKYYDKNKNHK